MDRLLDAPAGVRKAIFAAVAIVVVLLGYLATRSGDDTPTPETDRTDTGTVITQAPTPSAPAESDVAAPSSTGSAPVAPSLSAPLAQEEIDKAAGEAVAFTRLYASYRYDLDTDAWLADLSRYLSNESLVDLTVLLPDGPAAEQAATAQYVTTATAQATRVEFLSASTVTFAAQVDKSTSTTSGTTASSVTYEITMTNEDGGWRVAEARLVGDSADSD